MRNQVAIVVILLAMSVIAFVAFDSGNTAKESTVVDTPKVTESTNGYLTFEAYQLNEELYRGVIAQVNFESREDARTYQSIIEEGVKSSGVNFAGKYSVVTWGCGVDCQVSTIVDVTNGSIIEYGIVSSYGLAYSPWSALFIVNPIENIPIEVANEEGISSDFYILNKNVGLEYVRRHIVQDSDSSTCDTLVANARNAFTLEVRHFSSSCSIPYGWEIIEDIL